MRERINTIEMKEMAEGLSRSLSWCHNMLRSQEKMTSETAFRTKRIVFYRHVPGSIGDNGGFLFVLPATGLCV